MTFAIHATKDGQSVVTVRISPEAAVDKARLLEKSRLASSHCGFGGAHLRRLKL